MTEELTDRTAVVPDLGEASDRLASFIARQPIFDAALDVVGYELLFRNRPGDLTAGLLPDNATPKTIIAAFTEIGIDAIVGEHTAYINAPRDFLVEEHARALPVERVAIEVLEDVAFDPEVLRKLASLINAGYRVVLDDFVWRPGLDSVLKLVDGVKIEVTDRNAKELGRMVEQLQPFGMDLIAEKVETHEDLERCRSVGFTHFQGYFLSRPRVVRSTHIPADKLSKLALITLLQDETTEIDELERVISRDVGLSFRLLRYLNSAHFFLPRRVNSIRDAIRLIGPRPLRNWASLIVLADIDDQPIELVVTAMVRARMCELLALGPGGGNAHSAFTVGLFSVVDAILGIAMPDLIELLPFAEPVQLALVGQVGDLGKVLHCAVAYEKGDFYEALRCAPDERAVADAYLEAIGWADQTRAVLVE